MYNINSHYEVIFAFLKTLVKRRRMLYLHPYGSTDPQNIERVADTADISYDIENEGPMFVFYDQEPIYDKFNYTLFDYIEQNFRPPFFLITTEQDSEPLKKIIARYKWPTIDYFHHIFAASDWFREYRYNEGLLPVTKREIKKKYITFNRITGNSRVYRSIFINELYKRNLIDFGHISYSKICPVHGELETNINSAIENKLISYNHGQEIIENILKIDRPLRIDNLKTDFIKNGSTTLGPVEKLVESFVYVVTETCFWETKKHLTEKIFKPIVSKQPFLLIGCADNLEYLKGYGFKTFDRWWDEGYDKIQDPIQRLNAVVDILETICKLSLSDVNKMYYEMEDVLNHNYNLFFSQTFIDNEWNNLKHKFRKLVAEYEFATAVKELSHYRFDK
jgi:hypothetical protein